MIIIQFYDRLIQLLLGAATLTLITGVLDNGLWLGWIEGFSIYIATLLIVSIAAGNDWLKE